MSAIFISHRSTDSAVAAEIRDWLRSKGHRSVFLDFDPADGIPAGRKWEQELYQQLRMCRAVIVIASQASMRSKWVFAEVTQARALGKHIVTLNIDNCVIDTAISDRQEIDFTKNRREAYDRLGRGLREAGIDPNDAFDWDGTRPPFPGLMPFQQDDAAVFFGRDDEMTEGLDLLNRVRRQGSNQFAMILGASGSGKSSLVRAGLVPRLRRDADRWLVVNPIRPRDDPVQALARELHVAFLEFGDQREWTDIRDVLLNAISLQTDAEMNLVAEMAFDLRMASGRSEATVLIVIDQFEELLGYPPDHPSSRFLKLLAHTTGTTNSPLIVLGTLRSDFLAVFQNSAGLSDATYQSMSVGPLSSEALAKVIMKPAEVAGVDLETGLTELMVADTAFDDALPLLAFTLRRLYEENGQDGLLTAREYSVDLGGLNGAVATAADEVMQSQRLDAESLDQLRRAYLTMVRLTDEDVYSKQTVMWDDMPRSIHPLLERFVEARLLISDTDGSHRTVEVAHEALFGSWELLAGWLRQNDEALRLREEIRRASRSWVEEGRSTEYLWHGSRLGRVIEMTDGGELPLDLVETDFISASEHAERAKEETAERQKLRRLRLSIAVALGASALALVSVAFFFNARTQRDNANDQTAIAELQTAIAQDEAERADEAAVVALSRYALALVQTDPALAVAVAAEAQARLDKPETRLAVIRTNDAFRRTHLVMDVNAHAAPVLDVAFNDDGSRFSTASTDRTAKVWDASTGQELLTLAGHQNVVLEAVFSHDSSRIATASADGTAKAWNAVTGEEQLTLKGHDNVVLGVAFNHDSTRIATASGDTTVKILDATTGDELLTLEGHTGPVWSVAFDNDGDRVATASGDGTARIWSAVSGEASETLIGHSGVVLAVAYNDDGTRIATASGDGTAKVWDATSGEELLTLSGHDGSVRDVAYNDVGTELVTIGNDGTVRVWDASTGEELLALTGHTSLGRGVTFNHDGSAIATASNDQSVKLWDASTGNELLTLSALDNAVHSTAFNEDGSSIASANSDNSATIWDTFGKGGPVELTGHAGPLWEIAFSHDGAKLATASDDGTAKIWDATTGDQLVTLAGHEGQVRAVAFDSDGTRIATASDDGTAKIWDATTGEGLLLLGGHRSPMRGVAFNHDGTRLAGASGDGTAMVWDATTGQELVRLVGHTDVVTRVTFNHDSSRIATASGDGTAKVWDTTSGKEVFTLVGHRGWVLGIAFNHDGTRIATASGDGVVKVWDAQGGEILGNLVGHAGPVWDVTYNADGSRIATAGEDGTTKVWTTDPGDSCQLIRFVVTTEALTDALNGAEPIACTDL